MNTNLETNQKWSVNLLGDFSLENHDKTQKITKLRTKKSELLLIHLMYITIKNNSYLKGKDLREYIAADIWDGEDDNVKLLNNLKTELSSLRKIFGRDLFPRFSDKIITEMRKDENSPSDIFMIDALYWSNDVLSLSTQSKDIVLLEDTVRLYKGPFVPHLDSPWIDIERRKMELMFLSVCIELLNISIDKNSLSKFDIFMDEHDFKFYYDETRQKYYIDALTILINIDKYYAFSFALKAKEKIYLKRDVVSDELGQKFNALEIPYE